MRQKQSMNIGTPEYYTAIRLRKIWCEGNFSHQKERHNLKRTRKRGIEKVTEQCLLSACALNLKRLVKYLERNPRRLTILLLSLFFCWRTGFLLWLVDFVNSAETRGRRKTRLPAKVVMYQIIIMTTLVCLIACDRPKRHTGASSFQTNKFPQEATVARVHRVCRCVAASCVTGCTAVSKPAKKSQ